MDGTVSQEPIDPEVPDDGEDTDSQQDFEAFEREYQADHSWEQLAEDEDGRLLPVDTAREQRAKRRMLLEQHKGARIRKGMIRYMQVVMDVSSAAAVVDLKPNRFTVMVSLLKTFVREFFDQNPLSQLGILLMKNGQAEKLSELSASPEYLLKRLGGNVDLEGCVSLQNGLNLALESLKTVPTHGHREIVCLMAALNSCDPGDIRQTIKELKKERVRVSFIGLAAEVFVCKSIAEETGGPYHVASTEKHLEDTLIGLVPPPPAPARATQATLVRMGFPEKNPDGPKGFAFTGEDSQILDGGYTCNRCKARVRDLPCECHVCGLALVSSPHIARAYHHLFPVDPFDEVSQDDEHLMADRDRMECVEREEEANCCFGCFANLWDQAGVVLQCKHCRNLFCFECDSYIHSSLHNCPGCECGAMQKGDENGDSIEQ
ncbi:hypothetical protein BSKO_00780 [Bryopsis sp. KO-2023]|nr:hypothetical protein BSKO_00780 [Bryopsis sp. KO-2023]